MEKEGFILLLAADNLHGLERLPSRQIKSILNFCKWRLRTAILGL